DGCAASVMDNDRKPGAQKIFRHRLSHDAETNESNSRLHGSKPYHIIRCMENAEARKTRVKSIIKTLKKTYPGVHLALDFSSPLELLIALILAAQCTDERVNRVTPMLFRKYRTARDWAEADPAVLEEEIHTTGFFRQKTKSIQKCTAELVERFNG